MTAQHFFELFAGLDRAHGTTSGASLKLNEAKGKQEGKSYIVKGAPTAKLWERHLAGSYGLGIFPLTDDGACHWGAIDIDVYDIDHVELEARIIKRKLPLVVARTKSGGAHLFLFLSEPTSAKLIRDKLTAWASALGHAGVEVFPKQIALASENDFGNWLNMPYYGGAETNRYAIREGKPVTDPAAFLEYAMSYRVTAEELTAIRLRGAFDGPLCLERAMQEKVSEGDRNNVMFNFAVYLRKKYGKDGNWEQHLDDINKRYFDPPLPASEVKGRAKSARNGKHDYICKDCDRATCGNREYGKGGGSGQENPTIDKVIKIETSPVIWIVEIRGERVELNTSSLLEQRSFQVAVAERLNYVPRTIKRWAAFVDDKIRAAEIQPAPITASATGELWEMLREFCTDAYAMDKEELLNGMPWEEDGYVWFRNSDFRKHIEQQRARGWTSNKLWAALRNMDADHRSMTIKGKRILVWGVPSFDHQTEDFGVPKTLEEGEY